jgi:hypothetical protein
MTPTTTPTTTPTPTPAATPATQQLHAALAKLVQETSPAFAQLQMVATPDGRATQLGHWAIGFAQTCLPTPHFGLFANCHARARCVGCVPVCQTEVAVQKLSARCGGRPVLFGSTGAHAPDMSPLRLRSFVPGRPDQSDLWVPVIHLLTGELWLVAADGARAARPDPRGELRDIDMDPALLPVGPGAAAFARAWQATLARHAAGAPPGDPATPAGHALTSSGRIA